MGAAQETGALALPSAPAHLVDEPGEGMTAARRAVQGLTRGGRVVGLTKGRFSLLDILRAVLEITGPADVMISTWTSGIRDAETAKWLVETGAISSLKFLVDRSFKRRQPEYCAKMVEAFGADAICESNTHAKFATIATADGWRICVRSSMNLNRNSRWENFDIDDNEAIFQHFGSLIEELLERDPPGLGKSRRVVDTLFEQIRPTASEATTPRGVYQPKRRAEYRTRTDRRQ